MIQAPHEFRIFCFKKHWAICKKSSCFGVVNLSWIHIRPLIMWQVSSGYVAHSSCLHCFYRTLLQFDVKNTFCKSWRINSYSLMMVFLPFINPKIFILLAVGKLFTRPSNLPNKVEGNKKMNCRSWLMIVDCINAAIFMFSGSHLTNELRIESWKKQFLLIGVLSIIEDNAGRAFGNRVKMITYWVLRQEVKIIVIHLAHFPCNRPVDFGKQRYYPPNNAITTHRPYGTCSKFYSLALPLSMLHFQWPFSSCWTKCTFQVEVIHEK